MMAFIWIALVYVIVAFADITAAQLRRRHRGAAAAARRRSIPAARWRRRACSTCCSPSCMGLVQRFLKPPLWLVTVIFVPGDLRAVVARHQASRTLLRARRRRTWALLILAYCCVASMVPVWALLQPRGYLGGFVLYTRARARRDRHLLRRLRDPAAGVQELGRRRHDRHALPVPLRHHRLRRLLGLPRAGLLGHDLEADRRASRTCSRSATAPCWPRASWR